MKVLLIGGGGTLGKYTADELINLGSSVDIICLENNQNSENIKFYKANADINYLTSFLEDKYYDAIVNFIHYENVDNYKPVHKLLSQKTDREIFLSSYRVYADLEHPITENAPQLIDTVKNDSDFFEKETYALPKSKCERYISKSGAENVTIVRPVISFSSRRFDVVTVSGTQIPEKAKKGEKIYLPKAAKNLTAGLDWAGNSGKLIANLLFKNEAAGEAFTVSSAQNLTWSEITDIYSELIGAEFIWVDTDEFTEKYPALKSSPWILKYDRLFDRPIDNSKILKVTGLSKGDFVSIRDGIKTELNKIGGVLHEKKI